MLTLFLVFIITKGALTLYEGNTIGRGAVRGGDTAQALVVRLYYNGITGSIAGDEKKGHSIS